MTFLRESQSVSSPFAHSLSRVHSHCGHVHGCDSARSRGVLHSGAEAGAGASTECAFVEARGMLQANQTLFTSVLYLHFAYRKQGQLR